MAQRALDPDVEEFLDVVGWEPSTVTSAVSVLNQWTRHCAAHDLTVVDVTRPFINRYLADLKARGLAPATRRVQWRMLKAFYAWAATPVGQNGGGLRKDDPMVGVAGPSVSNRPTTRRAVTDDVASLIDRAFDTSELGRRNAAMVSLMFRSGVRVGELPWLDLADLVARPDGFTVLALTRTKTGEPRTVPIHPETVRYIRRYLRRRGPLPGPLFRGDPGRTADRDGRLKVGAIKLMVSRACQRAGVTLTPHQLRRAFTAEYLRQGGDVLSLEVIGGWADHRMPRRYLADDEAEAAVDRFFTVVGAAPPVAPSKRARSRRAG